MLTWLDHFLYGEKQRLQPLLDEVKPPVPIETDLDAARFHASLVLRGKPDTMDAKAFIDHMLAYAIFHFTTGGCCQGLRLDAALMRDFIQAEAPDTDDHFKLLMAQQWYLDIPHKSLMLNEALQVRALFSLSDPEQKAITVVAVLTVPGEDQPRGYFSWVWARGREAHVHHQLPGVNDVLDKHTVQHRIWNIIILIMLYRLSVSDEKLTRLPRLDWKAWASVRDKKQRAKQKKASMFSISDLKAPADHFGRADHEHAATWSLTQRVRVRGHFRWQAYGKARQQRKLIWISAHERGPHDAPLKPSLEVIHKDQS